MNDNYRRDLLHTRADNVKLRKENKDLNNLILFLRDQIHDLRLGVTRVEEERTNAYEHYYRAIIMLDDVFKIEYTVDVEELYI